MTRPRKRRTPEEARSLILDVAEQRLQRLGLDGLHVVGVAEEAGLSHANVIHHFGNTAGMRLALQQRLTAALLQDLVDALQSNTEPREILAAVFQAMTGGGHARLLAWRSLNDGDQPDLDDDARALFAALMQSTANRFTAADPQDVRNVLLLIASAAIGLGVAGNSLGAMLQQEAVDHSAFADWLTQLLLQDTSRLTG